MNLRVFSLKTLRSRRLMNFGTHHAKAGSCTILLAMAYSATSMGLDSLRSLSGIQCDPPSFHSTNKDHPFVVHRRCWVPATYPSSAFTAEPSFR